LACGLSECAFHGIALMLRERQVLPQPPGG
jgi:hypothetical protein